MVDIFDDKLLKCRKCGKQLSYLGSAEWGCDDCDYEKTYNIEYFYKLGKGLEKNKFVKEVYPAP